MLIFAGIRVLSVAVAAFLLGHGKYQLRHWSLVRWMRSSDGGHYWSIAAHGYTYPAGQLAHASVFSWFPGYPAVIDSIAWLPGVTIVAAGLIVTAVAGLAAAWGLTALGMKLTGDPRISLVVGALCAAVLLMLWSLTERIPVYLHVYTIVVVFLALTTSANWISSKPRFLLPAVLLTLPLARLLAPLRTSVLVPLIGVLAVATTWFGLYLTVIAHWTP
jgi:hypothetical protein